MALTDHKAAKANGARDYFDASGLNGDLLDLKWGNLYDPETKTLHSNWIGGFYANCSMALLALIQLANRGIVPEKILMDREWDCACNRQEHGNIDLYPFFFKEDAREDIPLRADLPPIDAHGRYGWLRNEFYTPFLRRWFKPSEESFRIRDKIVLDHKIELQKTIAVVYRGTDKHTEVSLARPEEYIWMARKLLKKNPGHRILIQTDQTQVREKFLSFFGADCFFLPELPSTMSGTPIHSLPQAEMGMDKLKYSLVLQGIMLILSRCDIIVNHTGNMGLWIVLYRGSNLSTFQFDRNGLCMDSLGREVHPRSTVELFRKIRDSLFHYSRSRVREYGVFE